MDKKIIKFIGKHHVMTLATSSLDGSQVWCCNLFYAFDSTELELVFTSSSTTRHIEQALRNPNVAASIVLESKVISRLQGLQITGIVKEAEQPELEKYKKIFLTAFPYAAMSLEKLWKLRINTAKLTDNTLGFRTKLLYNREP